MKKIIITFFVFALTFALSACETIRFTDAADSAPFEDITAEGSTKTQSPEPVETTSQKKSTDSGQTDDFTDVSEPKSEAFTADMEAAWNRFESAKQQTDALGRIESQVVVYSKEGEGKDAIAQTVSLRINKNTELFGSEQILAAGSVKAGGEVLPLNMYYSAGILISESDGNKSAMDMSYEEAISFIDVLYSFYEYFTRDIVTDISETDNADGTAIISFAFSGNIGATLSTGTGEIIIGSSGLIVSESFTIVSPKTESTPGITQSIESSLISCGENTPEIIPIEQ